MIFHKVDKRDIKVIAADHGVLEVPVIENTDAYPGSKAYNEICGYLKVSIAVTTKGDKAVQLQEEDNDLDRNDEAILMPAQLKPSY